MLAILTLRASKRLSKQVPVPDMRVKIDADKAPQGEHPRRFNAPTTNEVAVLIAGDTCENRDVVLHLRDASLKRIPETHRSYDALQYPLLFPRGDDGYHFLYRQVSPPDASAYR